MYRTLGTAVVVLLFWKVAADEIEPLAQLVASVYRGTVDLEAYWRRARNSAAFGS